MALKDQALTGVLVNLGKLVRTEGLGLNSPGSVDDVEEAGVAETGLAFLDDGRIAILPEKKSIMEQLRQRIRANPSS